MLLLSLLLIAFVTYFIWKPFLTLAPAASYQAKNPSQQAFENLQQQFKKRTSQNERPKEGYQGGEYIDFEEL
ncbi:MAG: hypothetical protein ACRBFS_21205 [Aureispira sp.]